MFMWEVYISMGMSMAERLKRIKTEEIFEATMTGNFPKLVIDTIGPGSS